MGLTSALLVFNLSFLLPLQLSYEHVIQIGEGTSVNQVTQQGQERGCWRCSWEHDVRKPWVLLAGNCRPLLLVL